MTFCVANVTAYVWFDNNFLLGFCHKDNVSKPIFQKNIRWKAHVKAAILWIAWQSLPSYLHTPYRWCIQYLRCGFPMSHSKYMTPLATFPYVLVIFSDVSTADLYGQEMHVITWSNSLFAILLFRNHRYYDSEDDLRAVITRYGWNMNTYVSFGGNTN